MSGPECFCHLGVPKCWKSVIELLKLVMQENCRWCMNSSDPIVFACLCCSCLCISVSGYSLCLCVLVNKVCISVSLPISSVRLYSRLVVPARHDSCIAPISPNVENNTAHFLANIVPQYIWGNLWQLMFYRYIIELWLYLFRGAKIFKTFFYARVSGFT